MQIGFTERGDAGINLTWKDKLWDVDGAVLITKNITDSFIQAVQETRTPIVLHCTCTGWGGTAVEPNVPGVVQQLDKLKYLIDKGFPKDNCVLRIDPILPNSAGLGKVTNVLDYANTIGLLPMRVRISIYDEYPHARERIAAIGGKPLYGGAFQAPADMMSAAAQHLQAMHAKYGVTFETCAEPQLSKYIVEPGVLEQTGCLSVKDIRLMGLDPSKAPQQVNGQNRRGCLCLMCKKELLTQKQRCPHKCIYCYWKD